MDQIVFDEKERKGKKLTKIMALLNHSQKIKSVNCCKFHFSKKVMSLHSNLVQKVQQ